MPPSGQAVVDANGNACVDGNGTAIVTDAGGNASCVCGSCPWYYRGISCNPGDCSLVEPIYVCSTMICTGPNGSAHPIGIGDIVYYGRRCYRIESLTRFTQQDPPPSGQTTIPLGSLIPAAEDVSCAGGAGFSCSQCPEMDGYMSLTLMCACLGSVGGGGTNPHGYFIKCADLRYVLLTCGRNCPVWRVEGLNGAWFCLMVDYSVPPQPVLPAGATEIGASCGYADCCSCCDDSGGNAGTCCSCGDASGTPACPAFRMTRNGIASTFSMRSWNQRCCWKRGTGALSGTAIYEQFYGNAGNPFDYRFQKIEVTASGSPGAWIYDSLITDYDPATGAITNTSHYYEVDNQNYCGFSPWGGQLPPLSLDGNFVYGFVQTQCDRRTWNYQRDNYNAGPFGSFGVSIKTSGQFILSGEAGPCNPNACTNHASGSLAESGGCGGCRTLDISESYEDLLL